MSPRKTLRIARWEVEKSAGTVDRGTAAVAILLLVVGGLAAPVVISQGPGLDDGIYRVGVEPGDPYHDVVQESSQFAARPDHASAAALNNGEIDLLVTERGPPIPRSTRKGQAAYAEFRSAVVEYNDEQMRGDDNQSAAFPVVVDVSYESRGGTTFEPESGSGTGSGTTDSTDGDGGTGTSTGGTDDGAPGGGTDDGTGPSSDDDGIAAPNLGGGGGFGAGTSSGDPSSISPPFPFSSLVLAFLFIVPMNFVIQAYGSTIINERINRRGELLLVAPVSRRDIIAGKTLPYFLGLVAVTVGIAWAIGGGVASVGAVIPIALLFLSATFVGGMFARSFKELTFVTIAVSVFLTSYVFVPAIFTDVTPIALISPLTVVVMDLQGQSVGLGEFTFATVPFLLTSLVLFTLGAGTYREEDMFSQRAVHQKALDAIATRVRSVASVSFVTMLLLPFVFLAELLAIAMVFILPRSISIPALFLTVAVIEEFAKSIHVYAGFEYARFDRSKWAAVVLGVASGVGFFLAEKLTLLVQLVQLQTLPEGQSVFPDATVGDIDPLVALGLLAMPLLLHTVTATISALGAQRSKRAYIGAFCIAVAVHLLYNLGVSSLVA
ncbi:ABC transporter permease subunit [Haloarchaeobius litoreus]|uniref:ABC transporter permease subunit n=1 Tax=Haloarchaeobius litoreus TaxID=755306 RepID=A0ABD6DK94_9EURY|nr:ABC transporter permease subunit [Haloarchaeobius litoreus]